MEDTLSFVIPSGFATSSNSNLTEGNAPFKLMSEKTFEAREDADPLIITCNANTAGLPSTYSKIEGLQISKKSLGSTEFERIIEYFPYYPLKERTIYQVRLAYRGWLRNNEWNFCQPFFIFRQYQKQLFKGIEFQIIGKMKSCNILQFIYCCLSDRGCTKGRQWPSRFDNTGAQHRVRQMQIYVKKINRKFFLSMRHTSQLKNDM